LTAANHDTLVRRLVMILIKLNQGEKLDPRQLAHEFDVNLRTVQRDINERFSYLPLEKSDGKYYLNPAFLGKLALKDIERFASLAGVAGLFPTLSEDFLREIFDARIQSALLIKGHHYEDLRGKEESFKKLEQAIFARAIVSFYYQGADSSKAYDVEPYRLVNNKGVWYLAARHSDKLKTFSFSKIEGLLVSEQKYHLNQSVNDKLELEEGVWLSEQPTEIVLKVDKAIAPYFKRRKLIANQVIEKELVDGSLILSAKVGHHKQVVPIVKYWIPHIRVISPDGLQEEIDAELRGYLSDSRY
jgi:predicted DNA-binding transcriptional regulator YafY